VTLRFEPTAIPGVIRVEPVVHRDERGFFLETYHAELYRAAGVDAVFVQDNHSRSARGTLRGLHAQAPPHAQGKLVRVIQGEVYDVAVDARRGSPTFGRFAAAVLSEENFHQLWVPPGMLHGFVVTSEIAQVEYKCTGPYVPHAEFSVVWNDPDIAIPWPIDQPLLSEKDRRAPRLSDVSDRLLDWRAPEAKGSR
jgi:dTDP-4-dehydrorhamnose 3,5-epimerase